ncbi:autism susceptibility gene 2 protein [Pongo abelii]|uniref:autism susceptibility gene 2 protein n=1 Tax=Pongo abelii TaxID=9601 RepID=UPI000CEFF881|nr:autism susceptibility gene 2 protein [Pongo abelii]
MKLSAAPRVWQSLIFKSPCPLRLLPPACPGSPRLRAPAPHPRFAPRPRAPPRPPPRLCLRLLLVSFSFPSSFVSGQTQPQKPATLPRPTARDPARREKPNTAILSGCREKAVPQLQPW